MKKDKPIEGCVATPPKNRSDLLQMIASTDPHLAECPACGRASVELMKRVKAGEPPPDMKTWLRTQADKKSKPRDEEVPDGT